MGAVFASVVDEPTDSHAEAIEILPTIILSKLSFIRHSSIVGWQLVTVEWHVATHLKVTF